MGTCGPQGLLSVGKPDPAVGLIRLTKIFFFLIYLKISSKPPFRTLSLKSNGKDSVEKRGLHLPAHRHTQTAAQLTELVFKAGQTPAAPVPCSSHPSRQLASEPRRPRKSFQR